MVRTILLAAMAAVFMLAAPGAAQARWLKAESEKFIVYSDGDEGTLRRYVQKLETFDRVLRMYMGLPLDEVPYRKLPIYLVRDYDDLVRAVPDRGRSTAGVYVPTTEDIFAVAIRTRNQDEALLHEYAHHFMHQNFAAGYPSWFVEGFAEYYMTADIDGDRVSVGNYNEGRASWLVHGDWLDLEDLLAKRPGEVTDDEDRATYYPVAWLLTHYFLGDDGRRAQLRTYLNEIGRGGDPVESMEKATGLTIVDLKRALEGYMRGRIPYQQLTYDFPDAEITLTTLPASADDLLLIAQALKVGVPDDERAALAQEVRDLAARHPGDPFARITLAHAELHFGDTAVGEALLEEMLEEDPDNVWALQLMASGRMRQAEDVSSFEDHTRLMREARGYLARAFEADDANYYTFYQIGQSRRGAEGYPSDNDIATWELAFTLAPQLSAIRMGLAEAYLIEERPAAAIAVLRSVANNPHGGGGAEAARQMIERAEEIKAGSAEAPEAPIEAADPPPDDGSVAEPEGEGDDGAETEDAG